MMNELLLKLLDLPWQGLIVLASGGAAYLLSYMGMRSEHRAYEATFITLVYALIATAVMTAMQSWLGWPILSGIAAFATSCGAGLIWRKYVRERLHNWLYDHDFCWSDDHPSAWATMVHDSRTHLTQVAVELDDGTWLLCDNAAQFNDAPFGPMTMGLNGDIALYLTGVQSPGEEVRHQKTVSNEDGDRITYVPASRIKEVNIRYKRRAKKSVVFG